MIQPESREQFLHLKADGSVAVVNVDTMEQTTFRGVLGEGSMVGMMMSCLYMKELETLVALVETKGAMNMVWKKTPDGKRSSSDLGQILEVEDVKFFPSCLCQCSVETVILAGGSTKKDFRMGNPILLGFRITDERVEYLDHMEFSRLGQNHSQMKVSCLTRTPKRNIFIAGVFRSVLVLDFSGVGITLINTYQNVHSSMVV